MRSVRHRPPGFALGVVLLVLTLVVTLATATAGFGALTLQQLRESERQLALTHAANGGLHELMDALYGNEAYASDGFGTYTASSGNLAYRWTFDEVPGQPFCTNNFQGTAPVTGWGGRVVPPGTSLLAVTATQPGYSEKTAGVAALVVNDYPYAVVADGLLKIGDVTAPGGLLEANVRSNLEGGRPNIVGEVVEGQTFSRDGVGSIRVDGDGMRNYDEPPFPVPDLPISDIVASFSPGGVNGRRPYGGPARFVYDGNVAATTDREGTVTIQGDAIRAEDTVYVDGDLTFSSGPTIAAGIHFFVNGDIRVNGSLTQLEPNSPEPSGTPGLSGGNSFMVCTGNLRMNGGSAGRMHLLVGEGITQNGSSDWRGLIYVQQGRLTTNGTQELQGVVIAKSGITRGDVLAGNTDVLYDPDVIRDLMGLNLGIRGFVRARSWWLF